jgi:tyrosyl-tRNA synthetase
MAQEVFRQTLRCPVSPPFIPLYLHSSNNIPRVHGCGYFIKFNGSEYWKKNQKTDMPKPRPSNQTKTSVFARMFFPKEAERIEELRKRDAAAKKARAAAEALAKEVKETNETDKEEAKEAERATDAVEGATTA